MTISYPRWMGVRQKMDAVRIDDPYRCVREQLSARNSFHLARNARVAVTVGSRCISNLVPITKAVIDHITMAGGCPFLVPAMGSHGGATDEGQLLILKEFGFTQETMGVPIHSSMEVVQLGEVDNIPVYLDKNAYEADGIVAINRIKPHQIFKGDIQSGLNKMLALGLGKQKGADAIHAANRTDVLGAIGDFIRSRVPVLFGVAILENSYDETREVVVVDPGQFKDYDRSWAKQSRSLIPRIPIRQLDMVIVDAMGKDISGSGMDTNVVGFTRRLLESGQAAVPLAVLDLTKKTEGNAIGVGLADFTTRRLVDKINYATTYTNVLATGVYSAGRIPLTFQTDKDILDLVVRKREQPEKTRIIRIKNTLDLGSFLATEALIGEILQQEQLETDGEWIETGFDENDNFSFQITDQRVSGDAGTHPRG